MGPAGWAQNHLSHGASGFISLKAFVIIDVKFDESGLRFTPFLGRHEKEKD